MNFWMTPFGLQAEDVKLCLTQKSFVFGKTRVWETKMVFRHFIVKNIPGFTIKHSSPWPTSQASIWTLISDTVHTLAGQWPDQPSTLPLNHSHITHAKSGWVPLHGARLPASCLLEQLNRIGHVHLGNQLNVKSITMKCSTWSAGAGTALG